MANRYPLKKLNAELDTVELMLEFNRFRWLSEVEASLLASIFPLDFARGTDGEWLNSTALNTGWGLLSLPCILPANGTKPNLFQSRHQPVILVLFSA